MTDLDMFFWCDISNATHQIITFTACLHQFPLFSFLLVASASQVVTNYWDSKREALNELLCIKFQEPQMKCFKGQKSQDFLGGDQRSITPLPICWNCHGMIMLVHMIK